jgi:hypothetical protein
LRLLLQESLELKRLEVHAVNCDLMDFFTFQGLFKLKYLSLKSDTLSTENKNIETAEEFLSLQVATILSLEVRAHLPKSILGILLKKCRNLRYFTIRTDILPVCDSFYIVKNPRKRIRHLNLEGLFTSFETLASIINLYPSVQELTLRDCTRYDLNLELNRKLIKEIMEKHLELTVLEISRMPHVIDCNLAFKKLIELRVEYVNDVDELVNVMTNTPTLMHLHIQFMFRHQSTEEFFNKLLSCNLKHIIIGAEPREALKIYKFVSAVELKRAGRLVTLKIKVLAHFVGTFEFLFPMLENIEHNEQMAEKLSFHVNGCEVEDLVKYIDNLPIV